MKTRKIFIAAALLTATLGTVTSCSDMLSEDSDMVDNNHTLGSASDSVYSVIGIINKMQKIADRTVLLGEVRGDLVSLTSSASTDLQALADFSACGTNGTANAYNNVRDYYAVINNCNYYLKYVDSTLTIRNEKVFEKEIAVVKTYRAWTYLQLALNYGSVPLVTEPVLTAQEAAEQTYKNRSSLADICAYFINDLAPYINTEYPSYGNIGSFNSTDFFIPVRVMLGDLCLWAGRYREAAQYYHDFFTQTGNIWAVQTGAVSWNNNTSSFSSIMNAYTPRFSNSSSNRITIIPMETSSANGEYSELTNYVFNSTEDNNGFFEAEPSNAYIDLSKTQSYCKIYTNNGTRYVLYAPSIAPLSEYPLAVGDLRLYSVYNKGEYTGTLANYSKTQQIIRKYVQTDVVPLYRTTTIYLHYAEALNRAGFPEAAFCVLKYGMTADNISKYVNANERANAGTLLSFSQYNFTENNTVGIHSLGCGDADADTTYVMPQPTAALPAYTDTVAYQQPLVEELICNEMALETSMEGPRFYDLMRIALHRSDPTFLANKVAARTGTFNGALYNKLIDTSNWYLPLP